MAKKAKILAGVIALLSAGAALGGETTEAACQNIIAEECGVIRRIPPLTTQNWFGIEEIRQFHEELKEKLGEDEYIRRQLEAEMRLDDAIRKRQQEQRAVRQRLYPYGVFSMEPPGPGDGVIPVDRHLLERIRRLREARSEEDEARRVERARELEELMRQRR